MKDKELPLPWERPGYGFSGPLDPLHDTRINARLSETIPDSGRPDIGAAAVLISRGDDDMTVIGIEPDSPDISGEDLQHIRQQRAHLR